MKKVEELTAKILSNNPSMDRYQLAIAVAKRTDELLNGATSKLNVSKKNQSSRFGTDGNCRRAHNHQRLHKY